MKEITCINVNKIVLQLKYDKDNWYYKWIKNLTFNGEAAGDNDDNLWFPMLMSFWNLIRLEYH